MDTTKYLVKRTAHTTRRCGEVCLGEDFYYKNTYGSMVAELMISAHLTDYLGITFAYTYHRKALYPMMHYWVPDFFWDRLTGDGNLAHIFWARGMVDQFEKDVFTYFPQQDSAWFVVDGADDTRLAAYRAMLKGRDYEVTANTSDEKKCSKYMLHKWLYKDLTVV